MKGDLVQVGTAPHVYLVTRDEQPSGTLRVRNTEGRQIRLNTKRDDISHAHTEEEK